MGHFSALATELDEDGLNEFSHLYTDMEISRIADRALQRDYQRQRKADADRNMHRQLRRLINEDE